MHRCVTDIRNDYKCNKLENTVWKLKDSFLLLLLLLLNEFTNLYVHCARFFVLLIIV